MEKRPLRTAEKAGGAKRLAGSEKPQGCGAAYQPRASFAQRVGRLFLALPRSQEGAWGEAARGAAGGPASPAAAAGRGGEARSGAAGRWRHNTGTAPRRRRGPEAGALRAEPEREPERERGPSPGLPGSQPKILPRRALRPQLQKSPESHKSTVAQTNPECAAHSRALFCRVPGARYPGSSRVTVRRQEGGIRLRASWF